MTGRGDTAAAPPLLALRGIAVRFGRGGAALPALEGIDLDVAAGAVQVILGGNGAGKTTLLRLVAGAIAPTVGRLGFAGARRPAAALVAQAVALYPFLTVQENCLAAGRMEGLRGAALRERMATAIAQTLAGPARDRPVAELSGGTQRRAAIAAALMGDAPLVVLDEPTTGLDAQARDSIVAICRSLRRAGKAVVLATHDFALADAVADVTVFLRDGRIAAVGAPDALCRALFGDKRCVEILPEAEPTAAQRRALLALGAEPAGAGRYSFVSPLDGHGRPTALARLDDIALRELRVAAPGTAALFRRHCGEAGHIGDAGSGGGIGAGEGQP